LDPIQPGAILVVLLTALYGKILVEMAKDWWNDPNASHGLLVPPLAAYIVWQRKHLTLRAPATPDLRGLLWIAGGCLTLLIGKLGAEFFLSRISLVVILAGLIQTFWGTTNRIASCQHIVGVLGMLETIICFQRLTIDMGTATEEICNFLGQNENPGTSCAANARPSSWAPGRSGSRTRTIEPPGFAWMNPFPHEKRFARVFAGNHPIACLVPVKHEGAAARLLDYRAVDFRRSARKIERDSRELSELPSCSWKCCR
jgi:hypothetical protein